MTKFLIFLLISISLLFPAGPVAASEKLQRKSYSFTVGNHSTETFEIKQDIEKNKPTYTLRYFLNNKLQGGRALTKITYEQMVKDFDWVLPSTKKPTSINLCASGVKTVKTTGSDLSTGDFFCSANWDQAQTLRFQSFFRKFHDLATSKTLIYEGFK